MSGTNDRNFKSYVGETGLSITEFRGPDNPGNYDDILKFSECHDVVVSGVAIDGGRENCIDAVRGSQYVIRGCDLKPNGPAAVVLKGSINGWVIDSCTVRNGTETGVEVGQFDNYWFPFRAPTRNGVITNTSTGTGDPVLVTLWDADVPRVIGGNVVLVKVPKWKWFPYFLFRYAWIRLAKLLHFSACILLFLMLSGCVHVPSAGWLPWNWGHSSEANRVDKQEAKLCAAQDAALKKAQADAHKTQDALAMAGDSRPVQVAKDFNDEAVALLDQVNGPSMVGDLEKWQKQVEALCSDDPKLRADAEKLRQKDRQDTAAISKKLADAEEKLKEYESAVSAALKREAEIANKYRNLTWGAGSLLVLAVIGYAGLAYLRYAYGGIPMAVGKGLSLLRAKHPEAGELATNIFDSYLNRHEQSKISRHA